MYIVQRQKMLKNTNHILERERTQPILTSPQCTIFSFHRDVGKWSQYINQIRVGVCANVQWLHRHAPRHINQSGSR